ncbi:MAG: S8 family serine peptidase [Thermoplasmatota archaeon]
MMWNIIHFVAAVILIAISITIPGSGEVDENNLVEMEWESVKVDVFDWTGWDRDLDGDRIDDLLEESSIDADADMVGINVHFRYHPSSVDEGRLLDVLGEGSVFHHAGRYSTALYLSIPRNYISGLPALLSDDITMIEYRPPVVNFLDVSAPATRSRESEQYSPDTAWDLGPTGGDMVIAVIDSGVDNSIHESLRGKYVYGVDFTGTTVIYGLDPDDIDGHGTHVAGTAMGTGGISGTYKGTAPDADLVDLRYAKVQGDFTGAADRALEWLIENHAEYDIRVASCSWGSTITTSGRDTTSRLVNQLVDEGVVVVVAAGNDGEQGLPSPASADGALTVGALDDRGTVNRGDDAHAWFSNRGPRANDGDLDDDDELKPDVLAPGVDIRSAKHNSVMDYVEMTGTSMSAPHVSGIVALMLQADPGLTPNQVKSILRDTAQQTYAASVPAQDPKYNYRSGWGYVDAYGAVKRALDLVSYEVQAPANVRLNSPFQVELTGHFTKTSYDIQGDTMELTLSTPIQWGPPTGVEVDPDQADADATVSFPLIQGGRWTVTASIVYNGTVEDAEPRLAAELVPVGMVGDERVISGSMSINGIEGEVTPTNVTISYDSLPPDLSITPTAIWFSDNLPNSGDQVDIDVMVNNTGWTDAEDVLIRFLDGPEMTGSVIGEDVIDVPMLSNAVASMTWDSNPGIHAITVIADPDNDIPESSEDNNSAERPITVRGVNAPPIAQLSVSPESGTTITSFTFDGSGSSDTNPRGTVVSYEYDFGDGESTGWINEASVEHIYRSGGTYTASLRVKDNGGTTSTNTDEVTVNVTSVQSEEMDLYLNSSFGLSPLPGPEGSLGIRNGSSPFAVGTWISDPLDRSLILHTAAVGSLKIWSRDPTTIQVTLELVIGQVDYSSYQVIEHQGGGNGTFPVDVIMQESLLKYMETFSLEIGISSGGDDALLYLGQGGSRLKIYYYPKENELPAADAGDDMDVKAGRKVTFTGSALDPDGEINTARWDVDGDGIWDAEGEDVLQFEYEGYASEGSYRARLEVVDSDGGISSDTAGVTVRPSDYNYAPTVSMLCPAEVVTGVLEVLGSSSDDTRVELVEVSVEGPVGGDNIVSVPWTEADGTDPWTFTLDTRPLEDGDYSIKARAFDGERFSEIEECRFSVVNPNSPPDIERAVMTPVPLPLDGETTLLIKVDVSDPDLPNDKLSVAADLSYIGGPAESYMRDDGNGPDTDAGDNEYTLEFTPSISVGSGTYSISFTVIDRKEAEDRTSSQIEFVYPLDVEVSVSPGPYYPGREVNFQVKLQNDQLVSGVRLEIAGEAVLLMDDGRSGDRIAGDSVYSRDVELPAESGRLDYTISVLDEYGMELYTESGSLTVLGDLTTPGGGSDLQMVVVIGIAVIVSVIAAGLLFLLLSRRRGNAEQVTVMEYQGGTQHIIAHVIEE